MSAKRRCSAWDGYYSDEYSDDDYTDQDDYTDCDDSGSEYGDERSEYGWEEDYDAIYFSDNTRSWNTGYNQRSYPTSSPTRDGDGRQCYNPRGNTQGCSHGAYRRTSDRAASMPPINYGRPRSEREMSTGPRNRRAATCEPRLLFAPTPGAKSSVAKGREFEDYFRMGVERARGNITAKVEFQKKLNITPGLCNYNFIST